MANDLKTRVDDDLYKEIEQLADYADVSLSEIQRRALEQFVDNHDDAESTTEQIDEQPQTLQTVLDLNLTDAPHDIKIERDPDVDWTDKDLVSRTYKQRLLVINAWLNHERENFSVAVETVNEMIADDEAGFGMSDPMVYVDRDRLEEHGIAYPSPVVDTDWDTDDLLGRVIDLKRRENKDLGYGYDPESIDEVLTHSVPDGVGGEENVWQFEKEIITSDNLLNAQLVAFLKRVRTLMDYLEVDSTTYQVYHLVLEDCLDYLDRKGLVSEEVEETRAWLDEHMQQEVRSSASEKMDVLTETEAGR